MENGISCNQVLYTLALNLTDGSNNQMRKTQMSVMFTELTAKLSGGLTLMLFKEGEPFV